MKVTYKEAKQRARKKRDIWVRKLVCDPITTPLAYLYARYTNVSPMNITAGTFFAGITAAFLFASGYLLLGAGAYFLSFLSDSLDGKLNRILGRDDTHRGIVDFILDGIVCVAIVVAIASYGDTLLTLLLLVWMSIHYLDMRLTSATYRLKVQFGDSSIWMINKQSKGWVLNTYRRFVEKTGTYPHPTVGEAVILMFVVGPVLWHLTGNIFWEHLMVGLGVLCIIPETIGAGLIAYSLAKKEAE